MEHMVSVQSDTHGMAGPLGILLPQLAALGHEALSSLFFKSSAEGEPRIPRASYSSSILHFFHPKSQFPLPLIPPTADRKQFSSDKLLRTAKSLFCTILCPFILSSSKLFFSSPNFPSFALLYTPHPFCCPALDPYSLCLSPKAQAKKWDQALRSPARCCMGTHRLPGPVLGSALCCRINVPFCCSSALSTQFVLCYNSPDPFCHTAIQTDIF